MSSAPSCVIKVRRAFSHLQELQKYAGSVDARHFHQELCRVEPDPAVPDYLLVKCTVDPPPVEPLSTILGDCVQNLRSALDHMVYALAVKHSGSLSDQEARACQFPIVGDEDKTGKSSCGATNFAANNVVRMIEKISPQAKRVIECMQPYQFGANYRNQVLWILNELSNTDKHRFIHVAYWQNSYVMFEPTRSHIPPAGIPHEDIAQFHTTILKGQTVVARMHKCLFDTIKRDDQGNVNIISASTVAFDSDGVRGREVVAQLKEIYVGITDRVFPPLLELL